jgi:PAS domain S-box-containing protein
MKYSFTHLKSYSSFLLNNHLEDLINTAIEYSKQSNLVILKLLDKYSEKDIFQIFKDSFEHQLLNPIIQDSPFEKINQKIEAWKANATIISKDSLDIADITSIHNIRKRVLVTFLKHYNCSKEDLFELINEIETYFEICTDLGLEAYQQIQKEELLNKSEILSGILAHIPLIVTKFNKEGKILFSAGSGLQALGHQDNDLLGQNIFEDNLNTIDKQNVIEGNSSSFVSQSKSKSGEFKEFQNYFIPEKDGALGFSIDISKQKKTEDQLFNLVEGVKDYAIFMLNPDGTIASWNEGVRTLKGYNKEEVIGKHFSMFYPQEKIDARFPEFELEQARKTGRFEDEGYRVKKDGTLFWANVVITPIYNQNKQIVGFTKITRDLTERKKAEEALKLSENRFRNLIEGVKDYAIFMLNPDGTVASWNEGARSLKGYSKEEIIGKHFSIFYPQDKKDARFPEYELEQAKKWGRFEDEGIRVRKDGSLFWANVILTPIYNDEKELIGFSKITRDLTERQKAEEALRRSEERYRLLIDAVKDYSIFIVDTEGKVASWNEGAKRLKQYSEDEIKGKHISIFYTQDKIKANYPDYELEQAKKYGRFEDEGYRVRKDGTTFYANVIITPLYDKNKTLVGFSKITRDLTERKQSEEKLHKLNQELEVKIKERTEELTSTILDLKKINNDLDNFVYTASHDLKAPISNIEGLIHGLYEELGSSITSNPEITTFKEMLISSIKKFKSTIGELTEIAKIQKESLENEEKIDIVEILKDIQLTIRDLIITNDAEIIADVQECPNIKFVKKNLNSILYNLISNGIKYRSPDRKPIIHITCSIESGFQIITVKDNGLGLRPENIDKMFTMFRRFHDHVEGSGVGLYIVKRIIENIGGKIEVDSTLQVGTTFTVKLPIS